MCLGSKHTWLLWSALGFTGSTELDEAEVNTVSAVFHFKRAWRDWNDFSSLFLTRWEEAGWLNISWLYADTLIMVQICSELALLHRAEALAHWLLEAWCVCLPLYCISTEVSFNENSCPESHRYKDPPRIQILFQFLSSWRLFCHEICSTGRVISYYIYYCFTLICRLHYSCSYGI